MAAKRTDFQRVVLVENPSDLKRPLLLTQIKLDLKAGIKIFLCPFSKIKDKIPEPDFGIWDDEYVCIVNYTNGHEESDIVLDSRNPKIKDAKIWKKLVLENSIRINDTTKDIKDFIKRTKNK